MIFPSNELAFPRQVEYIANENYNSVAERKVFNISELVMKILSYLDDKDLRSVEKIKDWNQIAVVLWNKPVPIPKEAIGREKYRNLLGVDVGEEPLLTRRQLLKIMKETDSLKNKLLILIPKTMDGKPVTLNNLRKHEVNGWQIIIYSWEVINKGNGDIPIKNSYWILVNSMEEMRDKWPNEIPKGEKLPTMIETVLSLFMNYLERKINFGLGYIRCKEMVEYKNTDYPSQIGVGHSNVGLFNGRIYLDWESPHRLARFFVAGRQKFVFPKI